MCVPLLDHTIWSTLWINMAYKSHNYLWPVQLYSPVLVKSIYFSVATLPYTHSANPACHSFLWEILEGEFPHRKGYQAFQRGLLGESSRWTVTALMEELRWRPRACKLRVFSLAVTSTLLSPWCLSGSHSRPTLGRHTLSLCHLVHLWGPPNSLLLEMESLGVQRENMPCSVKVTASQKRDM